MADLRSIPLLEGKVVIVLGASQGIGEGIAEAAFAAGAKVALGARNLDRLTAIAKRLDPSGERVLPLRLDMMDSASLERAVAATVERFGGLDAAINNAGLSTGRTPFTETSDEMFDAVIAVNLRGMFVAMKHEARAMLKRGGAIVNTSSAMGIAAAPLIPAYVASKHGVIGLTKSAALEFAAQGIRVNAIAPGAVMTEMLRRGPASTPEALEKMVSTTPIGRLGAVHEVAAAAIWLASDAASYITGVTLPVDGGLVVP